MNSSTRRSRPSRAGARSAMNSPDSSVPSEVHEPRETADLRDTTPPAPPQASRREAEENLLELFRAGALGKTLQRTVVNQAPVVNDADALGDLLGDVERVGRHEDRHAIFDLTLQKFDRRPDVARVEPDPRLVDDDDFRVMQK